MVKLELTDTQYAILVQTLKREARTWATLAKDGRGTPEQIAGIRNRANALVDLIDEVTQ